MSSSSSSSSVQEKSGRRWSNRATALTYHLSYGFFYQPLFFGDLEARQWRHYTRGYHVVTTGMFVDLAIRDRIAFFVREASYDPMQVESVLKASTTSAVVDSFLLQSNRERIVQEEKTGPVVQEVESYNNEQFRTRLSEFKTMWLQALKYWMLTEDRFFVEERTPGSVVFVPRPEGILARFDFPSSFRDVFSYTKEMHTYQFMVPREHPLRRLLPAPVHDSRPSHHALSASEPYLDVWMALFQPDWNARTARAKLLNEYDMFEVYTQLHGLLSSKWKFDDQTYSALLCHLFDEFWMAFKTRAMTQVTRLFAHLPYCDLTVTVPGQQVQDPIPRRLLMGLPWNTRTFYEGYEIVLLHPQARTPSGEQQMYTTTQVHATLMEQMFYLCGSQGELKAFENLVRDANAVVALAFASPMECTDETIPRVMACLVGTLHTNADNKSTLDIKAMGALNMPHPFSMSLGKILYALVVKNTIVTKGDAQVVQPIPPQQNEKLKAKLKSFGFQESMLPKILVPTISHPSAQQLYVYVRSWAYGSMLRAQRRAQMHISSSTLSFLFQERHLQHLFQRIRALKEIELKQSMSEAESKKQFGQTIKTLMTTGAVIGTYGLFGFYPALAQAAYQYYQSSK